MLVQTPDVQCGIYIYIECGAWWEVRDGHKTSTKCLTHTIQMEGLCSQAVLLFHNLVSPQIIYRSCDSGSRLRLDTACYATALPAQHGEVGGWCDIYNYNFFI